MGRFRANKMSSTGPIAVKRSKHIDEKGVRRRLLLLFRGVEVLAGRGLHRNLPGGRNQVRHLPLRGQQVLPGRPACWDKALRGLNR